MKQLLRLLEDCLFHPVTADGFVRDFLDLWREFRDRHYRIVHENEGWVPVLVKRVC